MSKEVFISYSSLDTETAENILNELEKSGIDCWIAPRDIMGGEKWASAIDEAIEKCKIFILVFSKNSNDSVQVSKEINLAVSKGKFIIPYKIDNTIPSGDMNYYLCDRHWLDAHRTNSKVGIEELKNIVISFLSGKPAHSQNLNKSFSAPKPKSKHLPALFAIFVVFLALLIVVQFVIIRQINKSQSDLKDKDIGIENPSVNDRDGYNEDTTANISITIEEAIFNAQEKADEQFYLEAIQILEPYINDDSTDNTAKEKFNEYKNKYVNQQIENAKKVFVTPDTDCKKALDIINSAIQHVPNSAELATQKGYYQSFIPASLCDFEPFKRSYAYINDGSSYDNFENYYDRCVYKPFYNSSASATYDINYKYNTFKATVFMRSECSADAYGTIEIYGDNVLLYQKTEIDVYGRPFDIEVNITGVQDLEIVITSDSGAFVFGLGNCILQRTVK